MYFIHLPFTPLVTEGFPPSGYRNGHTSDMGQKRPVAIYESSTLPVEGRTVCATQDHGAGGEGPTWEQSTQAESMGGRHPHNKRVRWLLVPGEGWDLNLACLNNLWITVKPVTHVKQHGLSSHDKEGISVGISYLQQQNGEGNLPLGHSSPPTDTQLQMSRQHIALNLHFRSNTTSDCWNSWYFIPKHSHNGHFWTSIILPTSGHFVRMNSSMLNLNGGKPQQNKHCSIGRYIGGGGYVPSHVFKYLYCKQKVLLPLTKCFIIIPIHFYKNMQTRQKGI